jgi:hypothetical protein
LYSRFLFVFYYPTLSVVRFGKNYEISKRKYQTLENSKFIDTFGTSDSSLNSWDHKEFNELVQNGSVDFEFSNARYFRFNKQTFIDSGKLNKKFNFLYILRTINAHISIRGLWGRNSKKFYNQIGYEESFETVFVKIGGGQADRVPCKWNKPYPREYP